MRERNVLCLLILFILPVKNADGAEHRREINAKDIWNWVVRNNYPETFAVLCYNCNCSLQFSGYCPHERE